MPKSFQVLERVTILRSSHFKKVIQELNKVRALILENLINEFLGKISEKLNIISGMISVILRYFLAIFCVLGEIREYKLIEFWPFLRILIILHKDAESFS